MQTGFRYAVRNGYDLAVVMDSDGQHDPAGITCWPTQSPRPGRRGDRLALSRPDGLPPAVGQAGRHGDLRLAGLTDYRSAVTDPTSGFQALNAAALRFFAFDNYPVDYPDAEHCLSCTTPVSRGRSAGDDARADHRRVHAQRLEAVLLRGKMWLAIAMVLLRRKPMLAPGGSKHDRSARTHSALFWALRSGVVINMVRTRQLQERYALLWLLAGLGLSWRRLIVDVLDQLALRLGFDYPPALLLMLAVIGLMLIICSFRRQSPTRPIGSRS